jgi:hypothetical protein
MGPDGQSVLQRFHSVLVQELGSRAGRNRNTSLTVADIYFDLVPFQSLRRELGVESVFDYERALLQLLAGQGGFLELEYIGDRHKLQRHLESRRSDPDLFRELLPAGVRICSPVEETSSDGEEKKKDLSHFQDCPSCTEALPRKTGMSFCPFCGTDLRRTPCLSCDEELKLDWRFCIACGTEVKQKSGSFQTH